VIVAALKVANPTGPTDTTVRQTAVQTAYTNYWNAGYSTSLITDADAAIVTNCWLTPVETTNYFYRCFPKFDSTLDTTTDCANPAGMGLSSTDAGCITMTETVTTHTVKPAGNTYLSELFTTTGETVARWFNDVRNSWYVIMVCGLFGGLFLSWSWVVFVQYCAAPIVWITVASFYAFWVGATTVLFVKGGLIDVGGTVETLTDAAAKVTAALSSERSFIISNWTVSTDIVRSRFTFFSSVV